MSKITPLQRGPFLITVKYSFISSSGFWYVNGTIEAEFKKASVMEA